MSTRDQLKIAIMGTGVAGAALAQTLFKIPHLDVHVYESAPALKGGGHAVGLSMNAQRALERLGPEFRSAPVRAGGVDSNASVVLLGEGPEAGQVVGDVGGNRHYTDGVFEIIVIRSRFLEAIMDGAPENRFHTDGIHGLSRSQVLGKDDPATKPKYAGFWHTFNLVPTEEAIVQLGPQYINPDNNIQHCWIGQGTFVLHDITGGKDATQIIACGYAENPWPEYEEKKALTKRELASMFEHMKPGPGIVALLKDGANIPVLPQYEHLPAKTYSKGNITLIGDAAHTMTPWQASGAGTTIEDVLFLSTLLQHAESIKDVVVAFAVYDKYRRPRTQDITASSRNVGLTTTGQNKKVGLDPKKVGEYLKNRWDFIHEYDIDSELSRAVDEYHQLREREVV